MRIVVSPFWLVIGALVLGGALFVRPAVERGAPRVLASATETPGVVNPDVTQENLGSTACLPGWSGTVRPPVTYTNALKQEQMERFGLPGTPSDYQEDHFISLSIGGHPTDSRNLWPEPIEQALRDDKIEFELHQRLCNGEITLAQAQRLETDLKQ